MEKSSHQQEPRTRPAPGGGEGEEEEEDEEDEDEAIVSRRDSAPSTCSGGVERVRAASRSTDRQRSRVAGPEASKAARAAGSVFGGGAAAAAGAVDDDGDAAAAAATRLLLLMFLMLLMLVVTRPLARRSILAADGLDWAPAGQRAACCILRERELGWRV